MSQAQAFLQVTLLNQDQPEFGVLNAVEAWG